MIPRYIYFRDKNDVGTLVENFKDTSMLMNGDIATVLTTHESYKANQNKWWIRNNHGWLQIVVSEVPKEILTTLLLRGL